MKYLLNNRNFIFLMVLFSFFDNFGNMINQKKDVPTFKVAFMGDIYVGKTQIIKKFMSNIFEENYKQTIGVDFYIKEINIKNQKIKLELWDFSGANNSNFFYKNFHLIIFVYAIDNKKSFENIPNWVNFVKEYKNENNKFLLVGNKCDLGRDKVVKSEEALKYANENGMDFIEVSAFKGFFFDFSTKSQKNIEKMLENSLEKFLGEMKHIEDNNIKIGKFKIVNTEKISSNKQNTTNIKNSFCNKYCSCCPCLKETEEKC